MGEKFVNCHIHSESVSDVVRVVREITKDRAYVSPPKNHWITVYDRTSDYEYEYDDIYPFAQKLSSHLSTVVCTFLVFSGLNFIYFIHDSGQLVDEFYDDPEAAEFGFDYADDAIRERFHGHPERLLRYCLPGTNVDSISQILTSSRNRDIEIIGQEAAYQLALLLGIDEERAISGYAYFEDDLYNEREPLMEDAKDFILVQSLLS
ncbi:MAG TPA: hypothetical protein VK211_16285 [Kamptonema sp.]|nr:hypothetical protein [Kamptonema sp.]